DRRQSPVYRRTSLAPGEADRPPPGAGPLVDSARESPDRARHGQPHLETPFRNGTGQDARQFRQGGNSTDASRVARLAGPRVRPHRLERQSDAPADGDELDLSPGINHR